MGQVFSQIGEIMFRLAGFALLTALALAPLAHADSDQDFLNELQANNYSSFQEKGELIAPGAVEPYSSLLKGHAVCRALDAGNDPFDDVLDSTPSFKDNGQIMIAAARHHLCPDTA